MVDAGAVGGRQDLLHLPGVRVVEHELPRRSATEIADRPSGVKYRLYGSVTGIGCPGGPVRGSNGVSWLPVSSLAYSVFMSHDGTTCCSSPPSR